jgi:hypothetical protein
VRRIRVHTEYEDRLQWVVLYDANGDVIPRVVSLVMIVTADGTSVGTLQYADSSQEDVHVCFSGTP